jgi:hypothetical protein
VKKAIKILNEYFDVPFTLVLSYWSTYSGNPALSNVYAVILALLSEASSILQKNKKLDSTSFLFRVVRNLFLAQAGINLNTTPETAYHCILSSVALETTKQMSEYLRKKGQIYKK